MDNYLKLVQQAKRGDVDAFAGLYQDIYEDLYRFAVYILKNPVDAQDVVSDTVVDAFSSIRRLRSEQAFKGWIFRILSNKCKRRLKEYTNRTVELPEDDKELSIDEMEDTAEYVQVRTLFWELMPEDRMIIAMHLFAGYTSKEIACLLHMNENTVRSRESRALKKMQERMKD